MATPSGLQYTDIREGTGPQPRKGQTAVVDWSGVTIGYYGRPFEARNKVGTTAAGRLGEAPRRRGRPPHFCECVCV